MGNDAEKVNKLRKDFYIDSEEGIDYYGVSVQSLHPIAKRMYKNGLPASSTQRRQTIQLSSQVWG